MAAGEPVLGEGGGQLQSRFRFASVDGSSDDCADVVQLPVQGVQPGPLIWSAEMRGGLLGEIQEERGVPSGRLGLFTGGFERSRAYS